MMPKRPWPGLFVTFEGGEGAGKSSLIASLRAHLVQKGHQVLVTREPGGTELGEQIRQLLLDVSRGRDLSPMAELALFLASRAQHLHEKIRPILDAGGLVFCDRFNDSTIVYQGVGRGLGMEKVTSLCHDICVGTLPDLTFYLDVAPEVGLKRALGTMKESASSGTLDRIESEPTAFHQAIRQGYLAIAEKEPERVHVIDAHQSPEQVFTRAAEGIARYLS